MDGTTILFACVAMLLVDGALMLGSDNSELGKWYGAAAILSGLATAAVLGLVALAAAGLI